MKHGYLILGLMALSWPFAGAQTVADTTCAARARAVVEFLAHDSLGGRPPGTRFDTLSAQYIAAQFASLGLRPYGTATQLTQPFTYTDTAHGPVPTFNVVGWLPRGRAKTIVIGAHYDHLGQGGPHSHEVTRTGIHNGADDNASGIALLLHLAAYAHANPSLPYNFLFVCFGGHETGMHGSAHFVAQYDDSIPRWAQMLNFDMVGRLDLRTRTVGVAGIHTDNPAHLQLRTFATAQGLRIRDRADWLSGSDHHHFHLAAVPVLAFTTGRHQDYHRLSDDAHRLNYPGLCAIAAWLEDWISEQ